MPYDLSDGIPNLISVTVIITIVGYLESIAVETKFAHQFKYQINPTQESFAQGWGNIFGGLTGAYPAVGSFSRSATNAAYGSKSPMCNFVAAMVILVTLEVLTPYLYCLPQNVLGAIVIVAAMGLVELPEFVYLYRTNKFEFLIISLTALLVLFSSLQNGIYASVSICGFVVLFQVRLAALFTLINKCREGDRRKGGVGGGIWEYIIYVLSWDRHVCYQLRHGGSASPQPCTLSDPCVWWLRLPSLIAVGSRQATQPKVTMVSDNRIFIYLPGSTSLIQTQETDVKVGAPPARSSHADVFTRRHADAFTRRRVPSSALSSCRRPRDVRAGLTARRANRRRRSCSTRRRATRRCSSATSRAASSSPRRGRWPPNAARGGVPPRRCQGWQRAGGGRREKDEKRTKRMRENDEESDG